MVDRNKKTGFLYAKVSASTQQKLAEIAKHLAMSKTSALECLIFAFHGVISNQTNELVENMEEITDDSEE